MLKRTHMCGDAREEHVDQEFVLAGWVNTYRDQGKGLIFIDIRDRFGDDPGRFSPRRCDDATVERARSLRREDVVAVRGTIRRREAGRTGSSRPGWSS